MPTKRSSVPAPPARRQVSDCLYYLLSRASLAATATLRRGFEEAGVGEIKPAYLGVLMCLWQEDQLKTAELGRRAGLEPSTMTGLVDRMEHDGLVRRVADPLDRRAQRVELADAARRAESRVLELVDRMLATVTRGLSEADLAHAKDVLRRVLANVHGAEAAGKGAR